LIAEVFGGFGAPTAELGFETAGRVVDAGVDDAAVMAGLMLRNSVFFLEDDDAGAGALLEQLARGRETDDAGADDAIVKDQSGRWVEPIALKRQLSLEQKLVGSAIGRVISMAAALSP